jgi:hypothetical protein
VVLPIVLTDEVPKLPKGCSEGFCHFWHCLKLGTAIERRDRSFLRVVGLIATGRVDGEAEWTWVGGTRGKVTARGYADAPLDLFGDSALL